MSPKHRNDNTVASSDGDKKITRKWNPFFLLKRGGEPTPPGWKESELPDGSEVAFAPSSVVVTKSRAEVSDEELEVLKSSDPENGRWTVIFDDGNQIVLGRRYASSSKKPGEKPRRDPPTRVDEPSKPKKKREVKNPCGFIKSNGEPCGSPAKLCESQRRHHWAPIAIPPPISGKEEIMETPTAIPPSGPTLDPATWFRAHEGDNTTQIKIEEIHSGVAMHSTEATVRRAEIDAGVVKHKTDAEVTMHGRKFDHFDHKVDVNAASERGQHDDHVAGNQRSAFALLGWMTLAGVMVFFGWLATRNDNPPVSPTQIVVTQQTLPPVEICARCGGSSCGGCDDGGDITNNIYIDGNAVTGTTVPCDCTTTTVPVTTTTVPPVTTSTTSTTVPSTTTTTTVPVTTTTTVPVTTTTTVPVTTTTTSTTIPGGCDGDGCPTSTTIPGGCDGDGCPTDDD